MPAQTKARSRQLVILLVDDDPDCRTLVRDVIESATARADVREASGGREALDYLRRAGAGADVPRPDLIYLDIELPGLGGQEVLRRIKADPLLRDIPVVMLTGLDDEEQRRQAARSGACGYVVKPSDPRRLLRAVTGTVRRWVRLHEPAGHAVHGLTQEPPRHDVGDE